MITSFESYLSDCAYRLTTEDLAKQLESIDNTVQALLDPNWSRYEQQDLDDWSGHGGALTSYGMVTSKELGSRADATDEQKAYCKYAHANFSGLQYLMVETGQSIVLPKWFFEPTHQINSMVDLIEFGSNPSSYDSIFNSQADVLDRSGAPLMRTHIARVQTGHDRRWYDGEPGQGEDSDVNYNVNKVSHKKEGGYLPIRLDLGDSGVQPSMGTWWYSSDSGLPSFNWLRAGRRYLLDVRAVTSTSTPGNGVTYTIADICENPDLLLGYTIQKEPYWTRESTPRPMFLFLLTDRELSRIDESDAPASDADEDSIFDL